MFYVFLLHIWNGNAGLKCIYISRTEGVSSGFHQKWCCSHKHGLHAWFPFVILKFSPRNVELNDGHFFFPRMDWVSGRSFADEPPTIRLGTRRHVRALWRLRVTTCQEEEIFWMYFLGWLDGFYWTMSQSKDFCCVYSCSNFKLKNYSSLHKCFLWWRSCCSNNMSYTKAHNPIKHPSLKLKTCYKSLHNIDLFSIAFSAACSVAKQRVATLLTWHAHIKPRSSHPLLGVFCSSANTI